MWIISILAWTVTFIALTCILSRLAFQWFCAVAFDPGRSLWGYEEFVIPPRWPFILVCSSLFFQQFQSATIGQTAFWTICFFLCFYLWFRAICEYRPFARQGEPEYSNKYRVQSPEPIKEQ